MMEELRPITVESDRSEHRPVVSDSLSVAAVRRLILGCKGERGTTLTVSQQGIDERLMLAVSGDDVFLGLERSDGILQFRPAETGPRLEPRYMEIGGQDTWIEPEYLLDIESAAAVVEEWLRYGEDSSK